MRRLFYSVCLTCIVSLSVGQSKKIIHIPDIPGYQTLKCDFHMHTVFSDGTVWPTVRVEEAWREGLDAIAITDHIEYKPHSIDIEADQNRSYEIAAPLAKSLNIILIKGAEITRNMPPGHFNALFINNANLLEREDVFDALGEASDQGAFIIWNHPGWKAQQPDTMLWWKEHTRLLQNNMMHGIEVYNYNEFYPAAVDWAKDRKLSIIAGSDVHEPVGMAYDLENSHRPMTLVFSRNHSEGGIREALFSRRTVAYFNNTLVGQAGLLEPIFFASLQILPSPGPLRNGETRKIELVNNSDINYKLELVQPGIGFNATASVDLNAHRVSVIDLYGNSDEVSEMNELKLYYKVQNMMVSSSENLIITLTIPNSY